jgi:hypothetical protein
MSIHDSDDLEIESLWFNYVCLEVNLFVYNNLAFFSRVSNVSICISILDDEIVDWAVLI